MSTWAVVADVVTKTGRTVDQPTLDQAEAQIEVLTGAIATISTTLANKRDVYWLKAAVCYQAAWLADQPDMYTRSDITGQITQENSSATFKADALTIAPLAKRAMKRLSWRGTRTLTPLGSGEQRARTTINTQGDDELLEWVPYE